MKELYTEIEINATPERVWQILTDFDALPEWNPFMRRASGEVEVGARLEVFLQPSDGRGMTFKPTVVEATPNREFRWLGHLGVRGLFDGEHSFTIEPLGENRVRFVQRESFRGLLVPLLLLMVGKDTRRGFEEMNQALKTRAEQVPA